MGVDEKRQLVHDLSKDSDLAFKTLQRWDREEIIQVLCAELGKVRKYNGWTKEQIINKLLTIVSEKKDSSPSEGNSGDQEDIKRSSKRRRKNANPTRFVSRTSFSASGSTDSVKSKGKGTINCKNLACQAILRPEDLFCKRCSCCICLKYDDNKDPSLWLTCNSDPPFAGESCGLSCHLECAFKSEKSGLKEDKPSNDVDGCFDCVSCGKTNSLLECWKKQLMIAKETTKVDELCRRLVLAQKLLKGTEKYRKISATVEEAVKSLETELCGPLTDLPSAMCRGIVNRLHSAPEVKGLCSSALDSLQDTPLYDHALPFKIQGTTKIRFEDVHATSLTLILGREEEISSLGNIIHYSVWHRKVSEKDYANDLTCELVSPNTRFLVSGLTPATEYCFKVVSFSGGKQSSVDEIKVSTKTPQEEEEEEAEGEATFVNTKGEQLVNNGKSSSSCGFGLEDCVRIIRQLEFSGYVDKIFRQKFVTWYSLKARSQEITVVKAFIDVFQGDPESLAEQLIDTFSDCISRKRSAIGD